MLYIKYDNMEYHWVGHLKTKPVDIDEWIKRNLLNSANDSEHQVYKKQAEVLNAKST